MRAVLKIRNSWKLVSRSFKVGTLLWTFIGFPIGNVQQNMSYQSEFAQSYT